MEKRNYKYAAYRRKLIGEYSPAQESGWVPFPSQKGLTQGVLSTYRSRINKGDFFGPGFTAKVRNGYLYAKYTGTDIEGES